MSIFDSREALETAIGRGRNEEGRTIWVTQIEDLRSTLAHPSFDQWTAAERRGHFQELQQRREAVPTQHGDTTTLIGWLMVIAGILVALGAQIMKISVSSTTDSSFIGDTYVPATTSDVINIGLLQNQMMVFQAGLAIAIGGVMVLAAVVVRNAIAAKGTSE